MFRTTDWNLYRSRHWTFVICLIASYIITLWYLFRTQRCHSFECYLETIGSIAVKYFPIMAAVRLTCLYSFAIGSRSSFLRNTNSRSLQDRPYTYNVTLWRVYVMFVPPRLLLTAWYHSSRRQRCNGNFLSLSTVKCTGTIMRRPAISVRF